MKKFSRRRFLKGTFAGATLVSVGVDLSACGKRTRAVNSATSPKETVAPKEAVTETPPKTPSSSLPEIKGRIVRPGDPGYDEARRDYNARFSLSPGSILYCSSESDVIQAVKWARHNEIAVAVRSGGHSYEAFSLIDGGAVIDVSDMTNISVDSAKKLATVESGVTLLPLYETLWEKRVVVPGGSCATVGIAGLALGGGYGLLARSMGLTCDNMMGVRMVDGGGNVVVADEKQNPDLLWACRGGGGGNFGIITQFTFRLHPIGNVSIVRLRWNWQQALEVMRAWQEWAPRVDDRMTGILTVSSKGAKSLLGLAMFLGPPTGTKHLLQPLLAAVPPEKVSVTAMPFIEAVKKFSGISSSHKRGSKPNKEPIEGEEKVPPEKVHVHLHSRFKATSDYVDANLSDAAINIMIDALSNTPSDGSCVQFDTYGGAINRVAAEDTAFCHRGATKFCLHYQICWTSAANDSRCEKWINEFRKAMQPHVSGFAYQNYCDREIEDWAHRYYGNNLERLTAVKRKFDPDNFFHFPQSVPEKAT